MTAEATRTASAVTLAENIGASSAWCNDCDWQRQAYGRKAWLALRAAARRHVRSATHPVSVEVGHVLAYAPRATGQPGAHL